MSNTALKIGDRVKRSDEADDTGALMRYFGRRGTVAALGPAGWIRVAWDRDGDLPPTPVPTRWLVLAEETLDPRAK